MRLVRCNRTGSKDCPKPDCYIAQYHESVGSCAGFDCPYSPYNHPVRCICIPKETELVVTHSLIDAGLGVYLPDRAVPMYLSGFHPNKEEPDTGFEHLQEHYTVENKSYLGFIACDHPEWQGIHVNPALVTHKTEVLI